MKRFRIGLTMLLLACSASTWAASITNLFVFGDSLSDPGNAYALSGGFGGAFPPDYGYPSPITRFTNGPTAAQVLAQNLGVSSAGNYAQSGGPNYAVGGALSGSGNFNWQANQPPGLQAAVPALRNTGVADQVARFAGNAPAFDPTRSLFMLWAGANDFFLWSATGTPASLIPTAQAAAGNVNAAVGALYGLGARDFLILGLPDLGRLPATSGNPQAAAAGSLFTQAFNATLAALLAQTQATLSGLDLVSFDVATLLDAVTTSPSAYGFSNATTTCAADPAALLDRCAGYVFWNGVHPTAAAHAVLGASLTAAVEGAVPLPGTLALLLIGSVPAALRLSRRSHAAPSNPFCRQAS